MSAAEKEPMLSWESPAVQLTADVLREYARVSGDDNLIHIDPVAAKAAGFDAPIAHGMLSAALLSHAVTRRFGADRLRHFDVRFRAITPAESTPTFTVRLTSISMEEGELLAHLKLSAVLVDGSMTVDGSAKVVLVHRDP